MTKINNAYYLFNELKDMKWGVTAGQTDVLCTFFEENAEVIKGYKKTPKCIDAVQSKWKEITPQLNSLGRARDHKSWAKYLCNIKAKLKRKRIKWRQSSNGTGQIICNADDFNEIELRMLQVLRKNTDTIPDSNVITSDLDMEDKGNEDEESSSDTGEYSWHETNLSDKALNNGTYIKLLESNSPLLDTRIPSAGYNNSSLSDEFDTFGKNIAQQLKTLPLSVALETQEKLLSLVRKQRIKYLNANNAKH